jgi:hypothetical protein
VHVHEHADEKSSSFCLELLSNCSFRAFRLQNNSWLINPQAAIIRWNSENCVIDRAPTLNGNEAELPPARTSFVLGLGTALLLLLFQLSASTLPPHFLDFEQLRWQTLQGCTAGAAPHDFPGYQMSVGTFQTAPSSREVRCASEPFVLNSSRLEFEYTGSPEPQDAPHTIFELKDSSGQILTRIPLLSTGKTPERTNWTTFQVELAEALVGQSVTVLVKSAASHNYSSWFALRNRLNFYRAADAFEKFMSLLKHRSLRMVICVLLAFFLVFWLKGSVIEAQTSLSDFALVLFFVALAVHFRTDVFFYWDEWHVLERFGKMGFPGIIYTHNEHFLPLFFGFFFVESRFFQDMYFLYILLSVALHTLNALLLVSLLKRLAGEHKRAEAVSRFIAFLYMLSALHSEVLNWAFEQSVLGAQALTLILLCAGLDTIRWGTFRKLWLTAVLVAIVPFVFGNGFIAIVQLALVVSLSCLAIDRGADDRPFFEIFEERLRRGFVLFVCCAVFLLLPVFLYIHYKEGAGHGIAQAKPFADPQALFSYLFVGSQLGTVLRGMGLFPSLQLNAAGAMLQKLSAVYPEARHGQLPDMFFAGLGFCLSLALLCTSLCSRARVKYFCLWLLGQLFILSALVLPSFGRWQFGTDQSLSLRYHSQALVGFCIMLLPVFLLLFGSNKDKPRLPAFFSSFITSFALLFIGAHIFAQLYLSLKFDSFTENGIKNHIFAEQLWQWRTKLNQEFPLRDVPYEGTDTPYAGLQPIYPETVTPGRHPDDIYQVLRWLK